MKKIFKSVLVIGLALLMALSSLIIVSAEELTPADDEVVISASGGGTDSPMAYQLVWKYRIYYGQRQRRRWNLTLGEWYDPYWVNI